jgi:integrase/recombinase XerC
VREPTIGDAIGRYLKEGRARGQFATTTVVSYRSILGMLERCTGPIPIRALQRRHIAKWYGQLSCSASTTRHRLSVVQTFTAWCVVDGLLTKDPAVGFRPPPQPRYQPRSMPGRDVARLLEVAPDRRARCVILLMVQMGLRCCEVSRLQVGDIDWTEGAALIRGKGSKERIVPIPDEAADAIRRYLDEHPAAAGPLVRSYSDDHRALTPGYLGDRMRVWMLSAGVKSAPRDGRSAHALRHTCATDVLRDGADVRQVQVMLGHDSLQTTQRYLGWNVAGVRTVMAGRRYSEHATP